MAITDTIATMNRGMSNPFEFYEQLQSVFTKPEIEPSRIRAWIAINTTLKWSKGRSDCREKGA